MGYYAAYKNNTDLDNKLKNLFLPLSRLSSSMNLTVYMYMQREYI